MMHDVDGEKPTQGTGRAPTARPQFTLRGLLLVVAFYAAVFSFLRCWRATLPQCLLLVSFFSMVALSRIVFFSGKRPLAASVAVGSVFGAAFSLCATLVAYDHCWALPKAVDPPSLWIVGTDFAVAVCLGGTIGLLQHLLFSSASTIGQSSWRSPVRLAAWFIIAACLVAGLVFKNTLLIGYYRAAAAYSLDQALHGKGSTPSCELLRSLRTGHYGYGPLWGMSIGRERYDSCLNELVDLGYFVRRDFVCPNIRTWEQSQPLANELDRAFPNHPYVHSEFPTGEGDDALRITVWDRPDRIDQWEAIVRRYE